MLMNCLNLPLPRAGLEHEKTEIVSSRRAFFGLENEIFQAWLVVRARLEPELHVTERDSAGRVSGWRREKCRETARRFRDITNISADVLCSDFAEPSANWEIERVVGIVPAPGMRLYELHGKADPVLGVDEGFEPVIRVEDAVLENWNVSVSDARDVGLDIVALEC